MNPPAPVSKTRRAGHCGRATGDDDPAEEAGDVVTVLCHSLTIDDHDPEYGNAVRVRLYAAYGPCAAHSSRVRVRRSHPAYARSPSCIFRSSCTAVVMTCEDVKGISCSRLMLGFAVGTYLVEVCDSCAASEGDTAGGSSRKYSGISVPSR